MFWRAGERAPEHPLPFDADRPAVAAARRDPARFEPLYRKYVAQVYSFAVYELRDRHAAEDATEQVFLQALAALPRFQERGEGEQSTFRVWLFQICRRVLSNERRRQSRRAETTLELAETLPAATDAAETVADRDTLLHAMRAIDRLPDDRRRALLLRFVEEMSTAEIAAILGRSEGAVRVLIHRALRSVAAQLVSERPGRRPHSAA
ncbi:MAG: RNA polymerase sigma factor [Chloroflexi bacterium]|nr:RNA polymerase sigma factor [Chloroflexota bacterium]